MLVSLMSLARWSVGVYISGTNKCAVVAFNILGRVSV